MSEQAAPRETLTEQRVTRRQALNQLANVMILTFGAADNNWRGFTWEDNGRAYTLYRGSLTEPHVSHANMIHITGEGDNPQVYSLEEDDEAAAPDDVFTGVADAINRHATQATYELAAARLDGAGLPVTHIYANGIPVSIGDFRNAPEEPFIWLRVGHPAERVAYDLTPDNLRFTDRYATYGPVARDAQQEEHTRWMLTALLAGEREEPRMSVYVKERDTPEASASLGGQDAIDTRQLMDALIHDEIPGLEVIRVGERLIFRTIVDHLAYDYETHASKIAKTAVGIYYDGMSAHLEAFPLASPQDRTAIYLNLETHTGSGTSRAGDTRTEMQGMQASTVFFDYADSIGIAQDDEMQLCTPEVIARFEHPYIRTGSTDDTVQ